jgi:heme exporter protein D
VFAAVFGVFVVALVVLVVLTVRWAILRDRARRREQSD